MMLLKSCMEYVLRGKLHVIGIDPLFLRLIHEL